MWERPYHPPCLTTHDRADAAVQARAARMPGARARLTWLPQPRRLMPLHGAWALRAARHCLQGAWQPSLRRVCVLSVLRGTERDCCGLSWGWGYLPVSCGWV